MTSGAKTRTKKERGNGRASEKEEAEKAAASRRRASDIVSQTFSTQSVGQSPRTGEPGPLCSLRRPTLGKRETKQYTGEGAHARSISRIGRSVGGIEFNTFARTRESESSFTFNCKFRFARKNASMSKRVIL